MRIIGNGTRQFFSSLKKIGASRPLANFICQGLFRGYQHGHAVLTVARTAHGFDPHTRWIMRMVAVAFSAPT
jgi:hypothetical protein